MITNNTNSKDSDKVIDYNAIRNLAIIQQQFGAAGVEIKKKLCDCPGAEPGKIDIDVSAHLSECWIRKRLLTRRYTINTSVTPEDFKDGYCLGVAV